MLPSSQLFNIRDLAASVLIYTRFRDPLVRHGVVQSDVFGSDDARELQFENFEVDLHPLASRKHEVSVRKTLSHNGSGFRFFVSPFYNQTKQTAGTKLGGRSRG